MPHLIGHNLRIGVLHDEPDFRTLVALWDIFERHPLEEDTPAALAMRCEHAFQVTEKRGLAASALSANDDIASLLYLERYAVKGMTVRPRVGKRQLFDSEMCHKSLSPMVMADGSAMNAEYATSPHAVTGSGTAPIISEMGSGAAPAPAEMGPDAGAMAREAKSALANPPAIVATEIAASNAMHARSAPSRAVKR